MPTEQIGQVVADLKEAFPEEADGIAYGAKGGDHGLQQVGAKKRVGAKTGLCADMWCKLLVLLQRAGAELVGVGVKKPSGKNPKNEIKLCRIGDVVFSVRCSGNDACLSVKIDDNASVERKALFRGIVGLESNDLVAVKKLESEVLADSDFTDAWIAELKDVYTQLLTKLTRKQEPRFLYKKLDWRKSQFSTPDGCVEQIQNLERSLLFAMSYGSHELFHTNVWAWLVKRHKEFARVFFDDINIDAITSVRREQGNRDLTIWVGSAGCEKAYVVENKFKSVPRKDQLDGYRAALGDKFAKGLIVTLDSLPEGFESQGWGWKSQLDVVNAISDCLGEGTDDSDPEMELLRDYAMITSHMSDLFSLYKEAIGSRWALALNHNEWDERVDGDLEMIRMADIFKKINAAEFESYLKNRDEWCELSARVSAIGCFLPLRVGTDFLHKLPVLNCDIVKQDSDGKETFVGVILQGPSFGRSAWSTADRWNEDKGDRSKGIYEKLNGGWFDDVEFLRPGLALRKSGSQKAYKRYDTRDYSFTYQDVGIESDDFEYLAQLIFTNVSRAIDLIEEGKMNDFFVIGATDVGFGI